ncbi:MAG: hypothetical protein LBU66_03330 [Treponema sp.]|jgi:hypothetical protein|nr:hypothetical protein [Treponema sp.]
MKKIILIALILSVVTGTIFAQSMPGFGASPQSDATQGRYRSAADNFIRPDAFSGVSFDKFFAMTSFASDTSLKLGYATRIGGAEETPGTFIGAAYAGSGWANLTPFNYTEQNITWLENKDKTVPVYSSLDFNGSNPNNNVAVLIGLKNMGFRLAFSSSHEIFSQSDFARRYTGTGAVPNPDYDPNEPEGDDNPSTIPGNVTKNDFYKNYEAERGTITPQIAWSMTKDLAGFGIRPVATLGLGFIRNNKKYDVIKEGYEGHDPDDEFLGVQIENSQNYFQPQFDFGLGGINLYRSQSGFRLSTDLDYRLTLRAYDNEYSYKDDNGKYKISTIAGLNNNGSLSENTWVENRIIPSLSGQWSGGPLALRFKLNLNFIFLNEEAKDMTIDDKKGALRQTKLTTTDTFNFSPDLRLATQWRIIPKLSLNAGAQLMFNNIGQTTVSSSSYNSDGKKIENSDQKQITNRYGSAVSTLTAGATFLPTDNLTFEASCGIGKGNDPNNITVFSDNGLFNFTNFLVSLRF